MKRFSLIGVAGYVAPRHLRAIKETGNLLVAALDKSDSVGVLDSFFPQTSYFHEYERFDRYIERQQRSELPIDYLTVCSPNYLHDPHIRFGLKHHMNVICEKPIVINPNNIAAIERLQSETGKTVYALLQLRLHSNVRLLKELIESLPDDEILNVDLTYITPRGKWYYATWKADEEKSGGISTNIGIHFFDLLIWLFGAVKSSIVHLHTFDRAAGLLQLARANVRWFMSINEDILTAEPEVDDQRRFYRRLKIGEHEIDFSTGFQDLHTKSYEAILDQRAGFTIADALPSIELVHQIRTSSPVGLVGDYHPLANLPLSPHPFTDF